MEWTRPELGLYEFRGARANNIVLALRGDPWGIIRDPLEQDPQKRYKLGLYRQPPGDPGSTDAATRGQYCASVADRHGFFAAYSPDGIHWTLDDRLLVPRAGDAGAWTCDPLRGRYIVTSRRYNSLIDHFALGWKGYRRVIALSTSADGQHWSTLETVLKPDAFDADGVQLYQMVPFVYGNQYLGILWVMHPTELSGMELVAARNPGHWQRVGRREEFFSVGPPGSWDAGWAACGLSAPALKGDTLYMWYSGKPQGHGTGGNFTSSIGLLTLGRDRFVALRCGIRGGELMTEPVEVKAPQLRLNAICLFGRVQVRVVDDYTVPEGYGFDACNGLQHADQFEAPITWGEASRDLSPFLGKKVRLHFRADNAASLYAYRFR